MELRSKLEYTDIIQNYLVEKESSDVKVTEKCIIAVEAYININWKRHFRIIALIRKRASHAIAIFRAKKFPNKTLQNINVIDILPLNFEFRLDTDNSRSQNGEFHPTIMSGEDFTLLDFDPLSLPLNSINMDSCDYNKKKFNIDFLKEDFKTFSEYLSNASQFIAKEELYSSFDWLKKLKDEMNSLTDINLEIDNSASDNEFNPQTDNFSHSSSSIFDSTQNHKVSVNNAPVTNSFPTSLMTSPSLHKSVVITNNVSKKPILGSDKKSYRSFQTKKSFDHYQSSPDLINSPFEEVSLETSIIDSVTMSNSRQSAYVEYQLRDKEDSYCNWENYTIFVGTWNVNGRIDDSSSLDDWLTPPNKVKSPAMYIIGFQEIDLSIGSVALNRGNISNLEERWLKLIETSTPFRKQRYKRLFRSRLSGILLIVYIDLKLKKDVLVEEVLTSKVPTGMFNVMGNKGAVGIRLRIFNSKLCFINCHLAAGESNRQRRDQDFREIEKNLIFYDSDGQAMSIYDHDLVFLMGDLNYRIMNMEPHIVKEMALQNKVDKLLENDELIHLSKLVFKRFYEGKIHFIPTYKFDANSDEYDTSEKNRVPSYCDRIMWLGEHCRQLHYSSHMSLKSSDHKPVSALFNIGLKKIDPVKQSLVYESIVRSMDVIYNLSLPQAKLDKQEINFEKVHFFEHRQASIIITNIGSFDFIYSFKEIPGSPKIPDWLTVQPPEASVRTGDSCELIFEIFINANNVSELNTIAEVQCILVLRLHGGKDYFITVTADLIPTSFGLPLSLLVSLKDPVASLSRTELNEKCKLYTQRISIPTLGPNAFTTPKEIFVMVDFLLKNICEEELFARPGSHAEIQSTREQLDLFGVNADFSQISVHSVTEALLMFINSLYFPIIPTELLKECIGVHNNFMEAVKVISKLPLDHQNLFHYITSFLRKVLDNRSRNGTDINSLGILFVDLIFRPKHFESSDREICSQFLKQFLINDPSQYFRSVSSLVQ